MKKEVGTSAGLLALIAMFVHIGMPHTEGFLAPVAGTTEVGSKKTGGSGDKAKDDEEVDGPWLAVQAAFHNGIRPVRRMEGMVPLLTDLTSEREGHRAELEKLLGLPEESKRPEMFSIVATVADPSHSHMSLFLDGQTEAIERSVQARGWDFAEQWLPWVDRFEGNDADINSRRRQRWLQREQEEMPGILVFRATPRLHETNFPDRLLFVFLVPETATSGIRGAPFFVALHLATLLSAKKKDGEFNNIGLLAPSFSGSFRSLSVLIKRWLEKHTTGLPKEDPYSAPPLNATVYSGSAVNLDYATAFVQDTVAGERHFSFHSGVLNSKDYQKVFCEVIKNYDLDSDAALLKEDEGGLQQSLNVPREVPREGEAPPNEAKGECRQLQTYTFPRDISHLRNAYQESANAVHDPYLDQPGRVNFSIRDPNSGEDSIPSFSETQTPIIQDTILSSITEELNRHHTHLIFISVTNPLDALFLLRAVRRACPNTRVVIENPALLFVPPAARDAFDGTVFLSTYPMFFEGDDWLAGRQFGAADQDRAQYFPDRLLFAEASLQGLFNVTQFLLTDIGVAEAPPKQEILRGYRLPMRGNAFTPGVWVLTLNRSGFLPVDVFGGKWSTIRSSVGESSWFQPNPPKKPIPALDELAQRPPSGWMLTAFILSIAIVSVCFVFMRSNFSRSGCKPLWLVLSDYRAATFQALLGACLSLSALEWVLVLPWCFPLRSLSVVKSIRIDALEIGALAGFLAPLLTFSYTAYMLKKRGWLSLSAIRSAGFWTKVFYAIPIGVFCFALGDWVWLCGVASTGLFFRFRALELYSGSSPSLPLALACLISFCICIFNFKRYSLAGCGRPRLNIDLSVKPGEPPSPYRLRFKAAYDSVGRGINAPWDQASICFVDDALPGEGKFDTASRTYRIVAAIVFTLICAVIIGGSARAFERPGYNRLLQLAVFSILLCLATKWYDLIRIWGCINQMLQLMQALPLQPSFERERIATDWPKRPIWNFTRSVSKEAAQREMLYVLHRRSLILKEREEKIARNFKSEVVLTKGAAAAGAGGGSVAGAGGGSVAGAGGGSVAGAQTAEGLPAKADAALDSSDVEINLGDSKTTAEEAKEQFEQFRMLVWGAGGQNDKRKWKEILNGAESPAVDKLRDLAQQQEISAQLAAQIYARDLIPAWRTSTAHEKDLYVRDCADFVTLQFCRFVGYAIAHVNRIAICVSISFVLLILMLNSYSPDGRELSARLLAVLFFVLGYGVWRVFSQMERNPILSRITHSTTGELNSEFWVQLIALGGLPLLGVISHLFPSVSQFLFQWIAPSLEATH